MTYLYSLLLFASLIGPLALSFDNKIKYFKSIKAVLVGSLVMMLLFIPWDIYFTENGIWGFNGDYLLGLSFFSLPIEEWVFFIVIPYACIFIISCVEGYFPRLLKSHRASNRIFIVLGLALLAIAIVNIDKAYTSSTFLMLGILLLSLGIYFKPTWSSSFLTGYLISLLPFLLINGVLTGTWIKDQVVWYNNSENLNLRVGTIPIEDFAYLMLLLLIVKWSYQEFKR